jgi:chitinase
LDLDLHGSWDADVKALGKKVRGQADIREIEANTVPLWFDGVDPSKLNFGLAMYGRGYTLADPSCSDLLCPFSGPSLPAPCTNFEGVMSLVEIEQLIKKRNLKPKFLKESLMKQITWDDQWIGYDDEETFAAKRNFADGLCFGGTMIWSIDFQVPGSGGYVYLRLLPMGRDTLANKAADLPTTLMLSISLLRCMRALRLSAQDLANLSSLHSLCLHQRQSLYRHT